MKIPFAPLLLTIVLSSCAGHGGSGSVLPETSQAAPASGVRVVERAMRLVSAASPTADRLAIAESLSASPSTMEGLESQSIENTSIALIDGATGRVIYNRPELVGSIIAKTPESGPPIDRGPDGDMRSAESFIPKLDTGSGPYRRVYSRPNPGYLAPNGQFFQETSEEADVTTICNGNYNPGVNEGFAYLGGWSSKGSAVDAGLQYNNKQKPESQDTYTPFFRIDGGDTWSVGALNGVLGKNFHLPCGGTIHLNFNVADYNGQVTWIIYAGWYKNRIKSVAAVIFKKPSSEYGYAGWSGTCFGCVMKRMTSIGEKVKIKPTDLGTTPADVFRMHRVENRWDHFTATWSNAELSCSYIAHCSADPSVTSSPPDYDGPWNSSTLWGCTEYPSWSTYKAGSTADCTIHNGGSKAANILVSQYSITGETDEITISGLGD